MTAERNWNYQRLDSLGHGMVWLAGLMGSLGSVRHSPRVVPTDVMVVRVDFARASGPRFALSVVRVLCVGGSRRRCKCR